MLGNYAFPLLVLDFSSSLQQQHMIHIPEDEAVASFLHLKKVQAYLNMIVIGLL